MTTPEQVLSVPMDPEDNDAGATSVRDYLVRLLSELWREDDMFSGKRPFGNSGWQDEVYTVLIRAGLLVGSFDEDGYLDTLDTNAADQLMQQAIAWLGMIS